MQGHFLLERLAPEYGGFHNSLAMRIYSSHMSVFMVLSGFFSANPIVKNGDIVKQVGQLLLPCLTLYIIFTIVGEPHYMWNLRSLFICYLVCDLYFRLERVSVKRQSCRYVLRVAGFLLFITLSPLLTKVPYLVSYKVDFMLPFFCLGILQH